MIGESMGADSIRSRISSSIAEIETLYVGSIVTVDPVRMKYNVQPTLKGYDRVSGTHVEPPILFECPMMASKCSDFILRVPYAVGDMVYVGVAKHSLDEAMSSSSPHENRAYGISSFRLIDGVILGGIVSDEEPVMPSSNAEDFLIQNRKTNCKFVMLKSGGLNIETSHDISVSCNNANITANASANITSPETNISGNLTVGGNIAGKGALNVSGAGTIGSVTTSSGVTLDGHTHTYNPGPSPPTNTSQGQG